ncbi:MAG TPA: kynureninase [Cerasibacillus sp.]|uniref:kynureninase n=1 Tax=Cerasibacillus sp. TaxID=2498711 RepID=UPI002F3FE38E
MINEDTSQAYAEALDQSDVLASFRDEFYVSDDVIYFDGNSLGLLSKRAEQTLLAMLESWKQDGIDGWTKGDNPWFYYSEELAKKSASLIGAKAEEVMITGSTTQNLHQLLATFYKPDGKRTKMIADELNFPSDLYAIKSQLRLRGLHPDEHLIRVKSRDGHTISEEDVIQAMTEEVAFIVLPSVYYRSGQVLDIKRVTEAAHEHGIIVAFDLCHSIGALPHELSDWGVDFAFWCTYKHLNAGPGAVGGLYVNEKHFGTEPGLAGWFGSDKEKQFDMEHTMIPAGHAGAYQVGTPHLLSAAPLLGSLEMFEAAGIHRIREKSLHLTAYMMMLIENELADYGFVIVNPTDDESRGAHIYLEHPEAARICKALKENNVIPDFRAPSGIRLAPVALYNTFVEVFNCIQILKTIMDEEQYKKFTNERDVVA